MKQILLILGCAVALAQQPAGQTPPPRADLSQIPDDQEIVKIDGKPMTMGQYRTILAIVAPANQAAATVDPGEFIMQIALMTKLAAMAEQQKLDQQTPLREQLEYGRLQALMTAELSQIINAPVVRDEDLQAYYNDNKERFKQVKLKAIKIAYAASPTPAAGGMKQLTDEQAKAKAERLVASIRGGADFVKLVRENCDDDALKTRDGDFQTVGPTDNIPAEFRKVVFQLKKGEVTDPIRQADGYYYILRADDVTYKSFADVRNDVYHDLKAQSSHDLIEKIRQNLDVQFTSPAFPRPRTK
jgi:peptidyl-prolyl cis-trans isomerase C